jgi:pyruvate kinase
MVALIRAGMDVARLNLSHGKREEHRRRIRMVKEAAGRLNKTVAILVDTRGPEVRTGPLEAGEVILKEGQEFILTTADILGDEQRVGVTYEGLPRDLEAGRTILIDDGLIELEVVEIAGSEIHCQVRHGGALRNYKGLNLPGTRINLPALSEEDREDLEMALEEGVHFVAASFTRCREDILEVRRWLEKFPTEVRIIAKIESREGMQNFDEILEAADGVMVARGDLGVEIPAEEVPLLQKMIIRKCNRSGKPVITATQMLESMIEHPRPTRAEASDVANAIFDGTDAVMLSGETAVGRFPVESVATMSRIARRTEEALHYKENLRFFESVMERTVTDAISFATCHTAQELNAAAIITATHSGHTARMVSKYKPRSRIIAVTSSPRVAGFLKLTWGVYPVLCPPTRTTDEMFAAAIQSSLREGLVKEGELVVITAGVPVGVSGTTNLLRVETVAEVLVRGSGLGNRAVTGSAFVVEEGGSWEGIREGEILVIGNTDSRCLPAVQKAAALIAEEGGLTSYSARVAMDLKKPAVVGAEGATRKIKHGQRITVDAFRGLIYRGEATVLR